MEEVEPEVFVYTSETKDDEIPKETLTHLRVDSSVTEIPANAFELRYALVQVQLPETLARIGEAAFCHCHQLNGVQFVSNASTETSSSSTQLLEDGLLVFPERAVLQVGDRGFSYCHSLLKVIVSSVSTILCQGAFRDCYRLVSVWLPDGFQMIEKDLLSGCNELSTVRIPSSVVKISDSAFMNCHRLTSVDLPHGLLEMEDSCFANTGIEILKIPSTVSKIGKMAFWNCNRLRRSIELPACLEIIEDELLYGCHSLEHIEIPTTVTTVGDGAFSYSALSHIRIPPRVVNIGKRVFSGCSKLVSLELPKRLAFDDYDFPIPWCSSLVNVALPTLKCSLPRDLEFGEDDFLEDWKLANVASDYDELGHILRIRFDEFPLHKLCYYQSYYCAEDAMTKLGSLMDRDPLAAAIETDWLGMTPLHILSLSQTPNVSMLLAVINAGHPDHLLRRKDTFGSTPMDYLLLNRMPNSNQVIGSLVQATIVKRLDSLGLDRWKSDILQGIDEALGLERSSRRRAIDIVYYKVAKYERKEILSLMELFLWKMKLLDDVSSNDNATDRLHCRINSGSSVVVDNVLPFLDRLDMESYFTR
eukprot:scaffold4230_cov94-Cylindrotheca_fusiformis.AAC.4